MEENNLNHPDHTANSSEEPNQEDSPNTLPDEGSPEPNQETPAPPQQNNQSQPYYAPWQNPQRTSTQTPPPPNYQYQNQNQPTAQLPKEPTNPMAVTSLILAVFSILLSCCCFPVGFIIGFVLAMIGLVLAILSKKENHFLDLLLPV